MDDTKNIEKYEVYKSMMYNLSRAMRHEFYYQAIFIEYAIIEDRCASILRHAGVKYTDSKGHELKISEKLKKMRGNPAFDMPYVRQRISIELLDQITAWKRERDELIHALAKIPYDHESVKAVAVRGQELVRVLSNKVKSVNYYYSRLQ